VYTQLIIHGSEDERTGHAARGQGPGRRGDAGEAERRGLEEADGDGEVAGGGAAHHLAGGLEAVAGSVTRPRVRGAAARQLSRWPCSIR
jgi:hypothetical protein